MEDHTLIDLLRVADESVALPTIETDLPDRVRRLCVRRRRIRMLKAAGGLATFVIVAGALFWLPEGPKAQDPSAAGGIAIHDVLDDVGKITSDSLSAVRAEIEFRRRLVGDLRAANRTAQLMEESRLSIVRFDVDRELNRTGEILMMYAQRVAPYSTALAANEYDQVARLWPESSWAAVARQRLGAGPGKR